MCRHHLKCLIVFSLVLSTLFIVQGCNSHAKRNFERDKNFNNDWYFSESNPDGAESPDFDHSGWRKVDLPHDWSMDDFDRQDSVHFGPYLKTLNKGQDVGYLRGGTAWYRKSWVIPGKYINDQVILNFDGIQSEATVYVNGKEAGHHVYGYTPFHLNITPYMNGENQPEVIAVKVVKPEQNSRWFTGAGIYRPVTISYLEPVHIQTWGVGITPDLSRNTGKVQLNIKLVNTDSASDSVMVKTDIYSPSNELVAQTTKIINIGAGTIHDVSMATSVNTPEIWDTGKPNLYTAKVSVIIDENKADEYSSTFGFRTIDYSADGGFLLNGNPVLLKGACMHHDNGLLGAAAFNRAEERRVEIMKKNGYNAIRTSHNPPSKAFLDACDQQGVLVIDEAFDAWVKPKRPNDYHQYFKDWWQKDLAAMVLRDRNHPSIIIWSIGNEIQERSDSSGVAIAKNMIREIHSIDTTRPVTAAICGFWDNPGREWDYSEHAFSVLDVGGYNYQWQNYVNDHERFPERIMVGTESVPKEAFENWQLVKEKPYVIGDFVWTGWDYLGESGIGHASWQSDKDFKDPFAMPWPWYISNCGDIDILGFKKPQSYFRDVVWDESKLEMAVHEPAPTGKHEVVSYWGWPQEEQSWNWNGYKGRPIQVSVYSSFPEIRLELNGKVVGEKKIPADSGYTVHFTVPYAPGELKASGIIHGEIMETRILKTTGDVAGIRLNPERLRIIASRDEIAYIDVTAVDKDGNVVPDAALPVRVAIAGEGAMLAAGNASPLVQGSVHDTTFTLHQGRGMVIARSTGKSGIITIQVTAEGLPGVKTEIMATRKKSGHENYY
ncbi:MAG TPA: glycoside hydrolase family 2 TIM barrel-domain containing protein [Bacteroidales bacterium]|nr:glycoside hydrolase family 2 TIM barrel-domain containing protein [Bacteroidales bacterium]